MPEKTVKRLEDKRRARPFPKPKENFYGNSDNYMTKVEDKSANLNVFRGTYIAHTTNRGTHALSSTVGRRPSLLVGSNV